MLLLKLNELTHCDYYTKSTRQHITLCAKPTTWD